MLKYYKMALEKGHVAAMFYLGLYYHKCDDEENMLKYYLMVANPGALFNLGNYYDEKKDYDNMLKYYLMAIDQGYVEAMYNLGIYYQNQKDTENMLKYYIMASEKGYVLAMYNLGVYYKYKNDYVNMIKYFDMAIPILKNSYSEIPHEINNEDIIKIINDFLRDSEDLSVDFDKLLFCKKYLDASNLKRFNTFLKCYYVANASEDHLDIKNDDCYVCFDKREHLLFHCGHSVCYICYDKINTFCIKMCPLCRKKL